MHPLSHSPRIRGEGRHPLSRSLRIREGGEASSLTLSADQRGGESSPLTLSTYQREREAFPLTLSADQRGGVLSHAFGLSATHFYNIISNLCPSFVSEASELHQKCAEIKL
ncbi:hypothetical protein AVEN_141076-1 [Araneus ventricosus]|uniref:Uncharacterized protein n=1 Tax=Araneus ventricosus TaxID=182803 RepID=A0A4Y2Q2B5_ARAVE|nr:hypothetical protein AVEN_141076-1 [Araneus ventricosus]